MWQAPSGTRQSTADLACLPSRASMAPHIAQAWHPKTQASHRHRRAWAAFLGGIMNLNAEGGSESQSGKLRYGVCSGFRRRTPIRQGDALGASGTDRRSRWIIEASGPTGREKAASLGDVSVSSSILPIKMADTVRWVERRVRAQRAGDAPAKAQQAAMIQSIARCFRTVAIQHANSCRKLRHS